MPHRIKTLLFGKSLETQKTKQERLSNSQGLAIFASDALSSTAYATEEILLVLFLVGTGALIYSIPIAIAIAALIFIVVISYRQTIYAYPQGGGGYSVAKDNFGEMPALIAGAAILIDYILTVAVSISAGVAAFTSAFPSLLSWNIWIALSAVLFLTWGNLRGVRESGKLFAIPTYLFIIAMFGVIAYGIWRYLHGTLTPTIQNETGLTAILGINLFLILRAFASGCTALTGIEATANGVQAFKPPEPKNAANTLTAMAIILGVIFLGVTFLAYNMRITPNEGETIVSQVASGLFGKTPFYFLIQTSTALILLLAANTPFAGFPRIGFILAKDGYFPRQFAQLGSKLVYSVGIVMLAAAAMFLLYLFKANTHRLIPLYAIGVFIVFTISQFGMIRHWSKKRAHGAYRWNTLINIIGGLSTFVVLIIVFFSKFQYGAWLLLPTIFGLIVLMKTIRSHYSSVAEQLSLTNGTQPRLPEEKTVIIPVSGVHQGTLKTIEFIKLLDPAHVKAVHIAVNPEETELVKQKWAQYVIGLKLDVVASPYRELIEPLIQYIEDVKKIWDNDTVIVALPEFVPTKFWHHFLHNQSARHIRDILEHREDVIIADVPYRLHDKDSPCLRLLLWRSSGFIFKSAFAVILWTATTPLLLLNSRRRF